MTRPSVAARFRRTRAARSRFACGCCDGRPGRPELVGSPGMPREASHSRARRTRRRADAPGSWNGSGEATAIMVPTVVVAAAGRGGLHERHDGPGKLASGTLANTSAVHGARRTADRKCTKSGLSCGSGGARWAHQCPRARRLRASARRPCARRPDAPRPGGRGLLRPTARTSRHAAAPVGPAEARRQAQARPHRARAGAGCPRSFAWTQLLCSA